MKKSPEGVTFTPTQLAKQSRPSKEVTEFFFHAYEARTAERRGIHNKAQLFIALIRPYNPVSSSTIARWMKSESGINILKPTVRSAAV